MDSQDPPPPAPRDGSETPKLSPIAPRFDKTEFARLILQAVDSLGLHKTAATLREEANLRLQHESVDRLTVAVTEADWSSSLTIVQEMDLSDRSRAVYLIMREQFLELLEAGDTVNALACIRKGVPGVEDAKLHELTSLMLCRSPEELRTRSQWPGTAGGSRAKLLSDLRTLIPTSLLVPARRLETLIEQALQAQIHNCIFHHESGEPLSLFEDHVCSEMQIPPLNYEVLDRHEDEVWYVQFSHNGQYLASASQDMSIIVWDFHERKSKRLEGHSKAVSFLDWSPDDSMILSCGNEHVVRLWGTANGECLGRFTAHTEVVTSCAWLPDGQHFVTGGLDKYIFLWDKDGSQIASWTDLRVNDLAVTQDGKRLVVVCSAMILHVYDLETHEQLFELQSSSNLTSLALSSDGRYALANSATEEVQLWDLEERAIVQSYKGHKQGHYVIRSVFAGADERFVISGSEDSQVYIWHRRSGKLMSKLPGHAGVINSVACNPKTPDMFASAADDNTVRLWTVNPREAKVWQHETITDRTSDSSSESEEQFPHL